ncbi:MAG: glycosyltransferase [Patescibacteria group bacterium]|jgi:glycosyltransferase involved in cell wall biosynthesis
MPEITPKISVIMPFYNAQLFLTKAIESILNQTFSDFELILINDASTDGSDRVVKKYLADPRIIYIKNENNQGIVHNLNYGLKTAKAEIIARMDGDDIAVRNRFFEQFNFLKFYPEIAVVGSFVKIIDENDKKIDYRTKLVDPETIKKELIIYSPVVHPAVMFRKSVIKKVGAYRQNYLYLEDLDLWYRVVYSGYKISNVNKFLLFYRYHSGSTAHQAKTNAWKAFRLRKETIKTFKLDLSLKQHILIYLQLLVGVLFSGRQRQRFEGLYKKAIYHDR